MFSNIQHLVFYILLSLFKPWARADFFTATAKMDLLLETQKSIIDNLDDYITKEEERLAGLKNHSELYLKEHEKAMKDIPNYLGNPLNAFSLIKRLTVDLDELYDGIQSGTENMKNVFINREGVMLPTPQDLAGAARALTRLQGTYQLDVRDLAEGRIYGVAYTHPMTAADCFELCKAIYIGKDYENSITWGMETLRKYEEETNKKQSFTKGEVMEHIGFSHYKLGNVRIAIEWTKKLLKLDPNYPRLPVDVRSKALAFEAAFQKPGETEDEDAKPEMRCEFQDDYATVNKKYGALCRGQTEINSGVAKRLYCRYMSETHPFLRLAPIKAEQVYIDPDVFVFHGVLSDDEIEAIKVLSMPKIENANFPDNKTGEWVFMNYRVCKLAWLDDQESPVVARVSQRVADMTGLSVESAEPMQVVNYGIGGHYEYHYDWEVKKYPDYYAMEDEPRIATVLFYMSDVALGGATVFTELGLAVFPARGAALYWRNLHPSGEGDTATRHAACPVLRGSKWVCNKWLHIAGQELINPCDLDCQQKEMVRKIPSPVHNRRGDLKSALDCTKKLLELDPNHPRAAGNLRRFEKAIAEQEPDTGDEIKDGKANSIMRSEEMEKLDIAQSHLMTPAACFKHSKALYFKNDFKNSLVWSMETLRKYKAETDKKHSFTEVDVLEYTSLSHYMMGDEKTTLEWIQELLKLDPDHPRAASHKSLFEKAFAEQEAAKKKRQGTGVPTEDVKDEKAKPNQIISDVAHFGPDYQVVKRRYEALCRGEMEIDSDVAKKLFCRYVSETHPFLRLAPIKAEQVHIDPDVFVFHGVLSDDEIETIKVLSMPRLQRATVNNAASIGGTTYNVASYRIGKLAWLNNEDSPVVARVSQRVADMTGLSVESAEPLQVVNYGIGGQFEPHVDFAPLNNVPFPQQDGNRIATVLFYMSDVAQGGATVFTDLDLSVIPERGAALYFLNLLPSGEGDTATRHAACPVLQGTKWVCNKWIHEGGQELTKPCSWDLMQ